MNNTCKFLSILLSTAALTLDRQASAQQLSKEQFPDSVTLKIRPRYDSVSKFHRWAFGENYRKEWATPVKMPVIKISKVAGGLIPVKEGGGMQSKSLRLEDKEGHSWVIRSVEKTPEKLLPENFKGTFVVDWFDDAMSSEHPFSALIVPALAEAVKVPHSNPVIGVVEADPQLGEYNKVFHQMVVLLEEREPLGKSDNTLKMELEVLNDHDNRIDGRNFMKARMLDLLIGDWDRHEDQWRWAFRKTANGKTYIAVPRDRDQVLHVQEGIGPSVAAVSWINPTLDDFDGNISRPKYSLFKHRFIQAYPDLQFTREEWARAAREFVAEESDAVLESALRRLPPEIYKLRHDQLLTKLKQRRDHIPAAMDSYYRFINETVDLHLSNQNEQVLISDGTNKGTHVVINSLDKNGIRQSNILDITYDPEITKEIRIYVENGNDHVTVNTRRSPIRLKFVGRQGIKDYDVQSAKRTIQIYGQHDSVSVKGTSADFSTHLSADTSNTRYVQNNPYNVWMPLATAAINKDDGFLLGAGFRYTRREGFRKEPYAMVQQLLITHSFATSAFRINYMGEWIQALGKADFTINALINAPNNTLNFFGRGNETAISKFPGYRTFYRTRYDTYQIDPALRWHIDQATTISAGPSFQYYHLNLADNTGRFINQSRNINSYDSASVGRDKVHLGLSILLKSNRRDNNILPTSGYYLEVGLQGYEGLNDYSRSYLQIKPQFTWYQKLDHNGALVLSDRVGGGVTFGSPAFYQSMFLGGQGNLLGYLQNRFAGDHAFYNNFQARLKLFNIASYILPGQFGLTGFNDTGRVWVKGEKSDQWHNGSGGGLYFAPVSMTVVQLVAGHSSDGWYPYLSFSMRL